MMANSNLPDRKEVHAPTVKGGQFSVRLRPLVTITGAALIVSSAVTLLASGLGVFSILGFLAGTAVLFTDRLLRKSFSPMPGLLPGESKREARIKDLKRYISKTQYLENIGDFGEITARHLTQISERYKNFQAILEKKFDPGELTFGRYHSAAEQTFLSILDNLHNVALSLNNLSTMDPSTKSETTPPTERQKLRDHEVLKIKELLSFNEQAITEFDRVSTALSQVQTKKGESDTGLEAAMAELKELADRAKKYSVPPP